MRRVGLAAVKVAVGFGVVVGATAPACSGNFAGHASSIDAGDESAAREGSVDSGAPDASPTTGAVYADISSGQTNLVGRPSAVIDTLNEKLLVACTNDGNNGRLSLIRCELDGTSCTHTDVSSSASAGDRNGDSPSAVIDGSAKLIIVTTDAMNQGKPSLFRCNLDGTACSHADISAGRGPNSGENPSAFVDAQSLQVLVVADDKTNPNGLSLFRCNVDGSSCSYADLSGGRRAGYFASAALDGSQGAFVVASRDLDGMYPTDAGGTGSFPLVVRCLLDGGNCTFTDTVAGDPPSATRPSIVVDAPHERSLVVANVIAQESASTGLDLFRCDSSGLSCTSTSLPLDPASGSQVVHDDGPVALLDPSGKRLIVAMQTSGPTQESRPSLVQCNVDGTDCTRMDISAGQRDIDMPSAVLDAVHRRVLVTATHRGRLALFSVGL
jgi:hypothetical protein